MPRTPSVDRISLQGSYRKGLAVVVLFLFTVSHGLSSSQPFGDPVIAAPGACTRRPAWISCPRATSSLLHIIIIPPPLVRSKRIARSYDSCTYIYYPHIHMSKECRDTDTYRCAPLSACSGPTRPSTISTPSRPPGSSPQEPSSPSALSSPSTSSSPSSSHSAGRGRTARAAISAAPSATSPGSPSGATGSTSSSRPSTPSAMRGQAVR